MYYKCSKCKNYGLKYERKYKPSDFLEGKRNSLIWIVKVSAKLYKLFGKDKGVAHTDIVKCFSNGFPPKNCKGRETRAIINNCKGYLKEQIKEWFPRIIICNGSPVCEIIKGFIGHQIDYGTSYTGDFDGNEITVILSGFIGRIDDYAKLRLGKEIEFYMEKYGIGHGV
jgi:hypothetical protein